MMDCNVELEVEINLFLLKLLSALMFYDSNRNLRQGLMHGLNKKQ